MELYKIRLIQSRFLFPVNTIGLLLIGFTLSFSALATEDSHYDRINLSVDAKMEVENDMLIAVVFTQREGSDLSSLSSEVNKTISEAIDVAKKVPEVKIKTLGYHTNPTYQNQKLAGWRVRQSLQFESKDIQGLSTLLGDLQKYVALESINYRVSDEVRSGIEEKLIVQAIDAFKKRAHLVTQQIDRHSYRLVNMDIQAGGAYAEPVVMRGSVSMMEARATPPAIEPGTQRISVNIHGTIELEVK